MPPIWVNTPTSLILRLWTMIIVVWSPKPSSVIQVIHKYCRYANIVPGTWTLFWTGIMEDLIYQRCMSMCVYNIYYVSINKIEHPRGLHWQFSFSGWRKSCCNKYPRNGGWFVSTQQTVGMAVGYISKVWLWWVETWDDKYPSWSLACLYCLEFTDLKCHCYTNVLSYWSNSEIFSHDCILGAIFCTDVWVTESTYARLDTSRGPFSGVTPAVVPPPKSTRFIYEARDRCIDRYLGGDAGRILNCCWGDTKGNCSTSWARNRFEL